MADQMIDIDDACRVLHEAYERAAVTEGWQTQEQSRVPWENVPAANKATMRAAVQALLDWQTTHNEHQANLGLATTGELLDEIRARIQVDYHVGGGGLGYSTAKGRPGGGGS